jgi:UDP-N-acetyl-D-galactosamine dehydrogenase
MGEYVASQVIKAMIAKDIRIKDAKVLILGITFKENCPDVRNTKVVDVVAALNEYGMNITIYDPWANVDELLHEYGITSTQDLPQEKFDAIVLTVAHGEYQNLNYVALKNEKAIVYDVKNILSSDVQDKCL